MNDGKSATNSVAVYDEPDHEALFSNDYAYAYRVMLAPGQETLWHKHTEDTVYVSFGAATGQEHIDDGNVVITDIPCGAAVSRPHRQSPLVHQVTNIGERHFHLIGAESLRRASKPHAAAIRSDVLELALETERFRTYRFDNDGKTPLAVERMGLLMLLGAGSPTRSEVIWNACGETTTVTEKCRGFYAEWR